MREQTIVSDHAAAEITTGFVTRTMTPADLAVVLDWAAAEGWNPGRHDGDCFRVVDPGGFIIGELDGAPAASISVVNYDDRFSFLGFYIVRPDLRGRGYGWTTAHPESPRLQAPSEIRIIGKTRTSDILSIQGP